VNVRWLGRSRAITIAALALALMMICPTPRIS
jgi:hypothetical protein